MIENKNIEYENTVVVGVVNKNQTEIVVKDYLDELSFLSNTAGGIVKKSFISIQNILVVASLVNGDGKT